MHRWLVHERSVLRSIAVTINWLSNGWLFAAIAVAVPLIGGTKGWRFVRVTAIALVISFLVYVVLKHILRRVRPCHATDVLNARVQPLDRYSCPSGHCMTAALFGTSLSALFPSMFASCLAGFALIAWSRVALGHHYPSDVALGASIGLVAVIVPFSILPL
ncbi:MAG TPA: phosphatase PAP2 family protein [Thermoanaerobaculia bacterium]